ncbi:(d)CMP kinase [Bittarella massiliensis]|uniref:(d)CMP kinase n=1 Tax=Bittarella (ex Durand et al. 2017) TaxID=1929297 RepID=UPI00163CA7CF|nr:(d)CMP kinase [Bittarella massiliensis (ex Durand et al. 2017)]MBC2870137.1 (d)CMP kinase [Bittarella massiliensis (ex Durand et al. 2017)]
MLSIAIDGPAGAGKSTIARTAAGALHFIYVDTGALYRAIGYHGLQVGADLTDTAAIKALLPELQVDLRFVGGQQRVFVGGEDVSDFIRSPQVSKAASQVSAVQEVRDFLMETQRSLARKNSVIMDGRDIGTVVLPDADLKIFLTASPEARAQRRCKELAEKGSPIPYEEVLRDIQQRDYDDSHREAAPLKQAADAVLVDTSELNLAESVDAVCALIRQRLGDRL